MDNAAAQPAAGPWTLPSPPAPRWYITHLNTHAHTSLLLRPLPLPSPDPSSSSSHEHPSQWSPSTFSRFFGSLTRHSRLRPDCIAADLHQPLPLISSLLAELDTEAAQLARLAGGKEGRFRNREKRWKTSKYHREGHAPAAREVGEGWVEREERIAGEVVRGAGRDRKSSGVSSGESGRETPEAARWLEELGVAKLKALDHVLMPSWAKWYADRLADPVLPPNAAPTVEAAGELKPKRTGKAKARVQAEEDELQRLLEMGAEDRERDEQWGNRVEVLKNRKRNRENYWRKKQGDGGKVKVEGVLEGSSGGGDRGEEGLGEAGGEERANAELKRIGVDRLAVERGLEVFNYAKLAQISRAIASKQHVDPVQLTLEHLESLRGHLMAYLTPLLLRTVLLGEARAAQVGEALPIDTEIVYLAIGVRGEGHPARVVGCWKRKLDELDAKHREETEMGLEGVAVGNGMDEEEVESAADQGVEHGRAGAEDQEALQVGRYKRSRLSRVINPPGRMPWTFMTHTSPVERVPIGETEEAEQGEAWELETTVTDEEDELLEGLLDKMDDAFDKLAEAELWVLDRRGVQDDEDEAAKEGGEGSTRAGDVVRDWTCPWPRRGGSDEMVSVCEAELARALQARDAYEKERLDIGKRRRRRHASHHRSRVFPTSGARARAGKSGKVEISRREILDSDEEAGGWEGAEEEEEVDELESEEGEGGWSAGERRGESEVDELEEDE